MKIIYVLRYQQQLARPPLVKACKRYVRCVWLDGVQLRPPSIVERVHQNRVAAEGLWGGHILDAMPLPQSIRAAKGSDAALS
jgi:hypothetical protein